METLFEFAVTRGPLRYEQQMFQRGFWGCSAPGDHLNWSLNSGITEPFKQAADQYDLVIYQNTVQSCVEHAPCVTEEEMIRRLIFPSHAELN